MVVTALRGTKKTMEDGKDKASKELGTLTGGASSSTTSEPDGDIKDANGKEFIAQLASTGLWKFHSLLNRKPVAPSRVPPALLLHAHLWRKHAQL